MEKVLECLKVFIEKRYISSIIAVVGAIISFLFIPNDCWILVKLGKTTFMILSFGVCFLILEFLIQVYLLLEKHVEKYRLKKFRKQEQEEKNIEIKNEMNSMFDRLSVKDKEIIMTFVTNENKIMISINGFHLENSILGNNRIVDSSSFSGDITNIDENKYWISNDLKSIVSKGCTPVGGYIQYKLRSELYHNYRIIYEMDGKLGNF